jgi:RHS repeat-associated protein
MNHSIYKNIYKIVSLLILSFYALTSNAINQTHFGTALQGSQIVVGATIPLVISANSSGVGGQDYVSNYVGIAQFSYHNQSKTDVAGQDWNYEITYTLRDQTDNSNIVSYTGTLNLSNNNAEGIFDVIGAHPLLQSKNSASVNLVLEINSITCNNGSGSIGCNASNNGIPNDAIELNLIIKEERYDYLSMNTQLIPNSLIGTFVVDGKMLVAWYPQDGAESYELEWVFWDTKNVGQPDDRYSLEQFFAKATRIELTKSIHEIDLIYPDGDIYVRVRPIGRYIRGVNDVYSHIKYGSWYEDNFTSPTILGSSNKVTLLEAFEKNQNWQFQRSYAEDGKHKQVIQYFDDGLKGRQTLTDLSSDNLTIIAESIYDVEGRASLSILPVPVKRASSGVPLVYGGGLITGLINLSGAGAVDYGREKFDKAGVLGQANAAALSGHISSDYYSSSNPFQSGVNERTHSEYIADAEGYPMTQTKYLRDATGRPSKQSGVGEFYQLDKGKETKYYYSSPTSTELRRLFGSNVGRTKHYRKNYVVDANGQISVSYIDQAGQTIATALAGISPDNVDELGSQSDGSTTIHADLMEGNQTSDLAELSSLTHQIFCDEAPRTDKFTYELEGALLSSTTPALCVGCSYELRISLENENGSKVILNVTQLPVPVGPNFNMTPRELILDIGSGTPDCANSTYPLPSELTFEATLPDIGTYTLRKVLKVVGPDINEIIEDIAEDIDNTDPTFRSNFIEQFILNNWTDECDECSEELRRNIAENLVRSEQPTLEHDFPGLFETEVVSYISSMATCDQLEEQFAIDASLRSECDGMLEIMKQQLSPDGCLYTSDFYQALYEDGHITSLDIYINGTLTTVLDLGDGVNLSSSNLKDYLTTSAAWQEQFSTELLALHPEYCRYQACNSDLMRDSRKFDYDLAKFKTWAEVGLAYNFSIGGTSSDWMELMDQDPYMDANLNTSFGAAAKSAFQAKLNAYCANSGVNCNGCADVFCFIDNYINNPNYIGVITPEMAWTIFRGIYKTQKDIVLIDDKCTINTYGMSPFPSCEEIDNTDPTTDVNGQVVHSNNLTDATSLNNAVTAGMSENRNLICEGHAMAWMERLCPECIVAPGTTLSAFCTGIKNELKAYCEETCGDHLSMNPMGYLLEEDLTTNSHLIVVQGMLNSTSGSNCTADLSSIAVDRLDVYEEITSANYPGYNRFNSQRCSVLTATFQALNTDIFPTPYVAGASALICPDMIQSNYAVNAPIPTGWGVTVPTAFVYDYPNLYSATNLMALTGAPHNLNINQVRLYNVPYPTNQGSGPYHRQIVIGTGGLTENPCNKFGFELIDVATGIEINPLEIISFGAFDCANNTIYVTVNDVCSYSVYPPGNYCNAANCRSGQKTILANVSIHAEPCIPKWENTNVWIPKQDDYTVDLQLVQEQCSTQLADKLELQAEESYDIYLRGLAEVIINEQSCLGGIVENFKTEYTTTEHHYTLYYYDEAGNLIQTLPPVAVKPLDASNGSIFNHTKGRWSGQEPAHIFEMATIYQYNTLGQVHYQKSPDGGVTEFWYDYAQRLRLSQNANQIQPTENAYAYTKFDAQGRAVEAGELDNYVVTPYSDQFTEDINNPDFPSSNTSERIITEYDQADFSPIDQSNLRGRVAKTYNDNIATYYDYDIHGNVKTLHHQIADFGASQIDYEYDLITGNVNKVAFHKGTDDQFFHRYNYDADNRLTYVETSNNEYVWDRDARYFYYAHGPLARVELGADKVQGLDYFYNLQGWIKGVNNTTPNTDMGHDGLAGTANAIFGKDEAAYYLGYHNQDYKPIGLASNATIMGVFEHSSAFDSDILGTNGLYNGNIAFMISHIPELGKSTTGSVETQAMVYQYDALHRIRQAKSYNYNSVWNNSYQYKSDYTYDANGNIKTLNRSAFDNTAGVSVDIDDLDYIYDPIKYNRLNSIDDIIGAGGMNDVDDINSFTYDEIGNLIDDGSNVIEWNLQNKVATVNNASYQIVYNYDISGNRLSKALTPIGSTTVTTTFYIRDGSGNIMGTYEVIDNGTLTKDIKENSIYGSSRLGVHNYDVPLNGTTFSMVSTLPRLMNEVLPVSNSTKWEMTRGKKVFEISNHLGNVLATLSDKKLGIDNGTDGIADSYVAQVQSAQDYYPFGWEMPGRKFNSGNYCFGFNGMEKDPEIEGGNYDFGARIYDSRICKFLSVDPLSSDFPGESNYIFAGNSPIVLIDVEGKFKFNPQTLKMLKEKYPTAYKYLVETAMDKKGNILDIVKNKDVRLIMIKNTQLYQAKLNQSLSRQGKQFLTEGARIILESAGPEDKLSHDEILSSFSYGNGPEVVFRDKPGGLLYGANGYNRNDDGTKYCCYPRPQDGEMYNSEIELNIGLLDAIEHAKTELDLKAALMGLESIIIHEYMEDFGADSENYGNGDFGARETQSQIFSGESPGVVSELDVKKLDYSSPAAKRAIMKLEKTNPERIPTIPE